MFTRLFKILLEVVGAIVAGAVVLFLLAFWRLSSGPLPLDTITPYVEEALSAEVPGVSVSIGETHLEWRGWRRALDLTAGQVVLRDEADGQVILDIPSLSILVSAKALLRATIAPVRVTLDSPTLVMSRDREGRFHVADGLDGALADMGDNRVTRMDGFVRGLLAPAKTDRNLETLRLIEVRDAAVTLRDEGLDATIQARGAAITLRRNPSGARIDIAARIDAPELVAEAHFEGHYDAVARSLDGTAVFEGLDAARLLERAPVEFGSLIGLDARLDGSISFRSGSELGLSVASAVIASKSARIDLPTLYPKPKRVEDLAARLEFDGTRQTVRVKGLTFSIGEMRAEANASATNFGPDTTLSLEASVWQVPTNTVRGYWPESLGVDARKWVMANLEDGMAHQATVSLGGKIPQWDPDRVEIDHLEGRIDFEGVTTHYLRPLPPARDVRGHALFDRTSFRIFLDGGHVNRVRGVEAAIRLMDLETDQEFAVIDVAAQGPLRDVLEIIDSEPLGYARALELQPDVVEGLVGARARFEFPLRNDLTLGDLRIGASANLDSVTLPNVVLGRDFSQATLSLKLDGNGMILTGDGRLDTMPIKVNLQQFFRPGTTLQRVIKAYGEFDETHLTGFDLDLSPYVSGTVAADLLVKERAGGQVEVSSVLDLRKAEARIPQIAWRKPVGAAGTLRLSLEVRDGKPVRISDLNLIAADLGLSANASFDAEGEGIAAARISRLVIGESDIKGGFARRPSGGYVADLSGPQLDLRPFIEQYDDADGDSGVPFELNVAFDRVLVGGLRPLTGVAGNLHHDGRVLKSVAVTGMIGDGRVSVLVQPDGAGRHFRLTSNDAGQVLQDFDLLENVRGGELAIDGRMRGGEDGQYIDAHLRVDRFRMVDAPVLAQVLSVATLSGLVDSLQGRGIRFTRLDADISITPDQITLTDALAFGPSLGISADGGISRADDQTDIRGMVVPAYGLSRLIDRIPILGRILTGGEREGLLAAEYLLGGDIRNPKVTVNPLTALAPGFLRNLVKATSGVEGETSGIAEESETNPGN